MNFAVILSLIAHFGEISTLFFDFQAMAADLKAVVTDTNFAKILAANPALQTAVTTLSALWRDAEGKAYDIEHDENFVSKIKAFEAEGVDVEKLVASFGAFIKSPSVAEFLASEEADAFPEVTDFEKMYNDLSAAIKDVFGKSLPAT